MSSIDIFIPLVVGCVMIFFPQVFFKKKKVLDYEDKVLKLRVIGGLLIGVAAVYFFMRLSKP
jgi:hypothetical protein